MSDFNALAHNIRKYRKRKHLTQSELASELFITAQNVSKWEQGLSLPSLNSLVALSRVLSVSVDELLGTVTQDKPKSMIAIDGGGTKTEFVMFREDGQVIKRLIFSGSNPNSCGMDTALSVLRNGLDELIAEFGEPAAIYAGIAGCSAKENKREIVSFIKKNYIGINISVETDVINLINCASENERMIALVCGTGSAVYAKTPEGVHRVGGWGYLFDNGGSGYDIGRDAICAALAERDGVGKKTLITELVEGKLGGDVWSKISELYTLGRDYIASFAGIVFDCCNKGDEEAYNIVEKNTERLASLLKCAAHLYDCGKKVTVSGGLCAYRDILLPRLTQKTGGIFDFDFNAMPQIYGASIGALSLIHRSADDSFTKRFTESYKNAEN